MGFDCETASENGPLRRETIARDAVTATAGLAAFFCRYRRIAVLTGAGLSTGSGIPDYRDDAGRWKHPRPVQFPDFVRCAETRRRYWARSYRGWVRIAGARPNAAHLAIAGLERMGRVRGVITQNVDGLHRRAGSRNVIDLHGVLANIRCTGCGAATSRQAFQVLLDRRNPGWQVTASRFGPDGDSILETDAWRCFQVPDCGDCGGIVKPDVVFFGERVPAPRVERAAGLVESSDALLVVGSSLMVFSGYRFARMAAAAGIPIAILNRGVTRADALATWRFAGDCTSLLPGSVAKLAI